MELIQELTKNLGVSEGQAKDGAGLLFKHAQQNLGGDDFSKVSSAVPSIGSIMDAAPKSGGGALDGLGGLASGLGGGAGGIMGLVGGFSQLGMGGDMVGKFISIVLSFVQSKGGGGVRAVLENALK